ncbi:MAG: hypothetical protein J2P37_19930 [Ktedonobacteraceae bacterium]|nr:hypothetical protein [Ktedonobacteraceae bacterium]MBO0789947.1 hypothetical protein [Ktedonobacteraceae bacterium]
MKDQEALQHDFLLYVPEVQSEPACTEGREEVAADQYIDLPPGLEDWTVFRLSFSDRPHHLTLFLHTFSEC